VIERLSALFAGTATKDGERGADWWLKQYGGLPGYYITPEEAKKNGWRPKAGNLAEVLPGKMIFGGIYTTGTGTCRPLRPRLV
jgi:hypothetical protein